ncbi:PREDICTED: uncharacterized protein LOC104589187 [Nelumbo nucifera]|uniref:Uncharacterized protein LOC104589187 n=1 Tax=Nelumbo nucifera TaxID=4432 RepID=A0A1U7YYM7_NELNU|nr:PREDICTED: uncharacterized protein LOC104589187 [Nelumbo nucifera]
MPLTRLVADAFGVVTICLVSLLTLLGLLCILYSIYFRSRIRGQGFSQLRYFNGPWIIRITLILFAIWWGVGEIVRLSLLRRGGRVFDSFSLKWQETICEFYILSNLGFSEPCLFLTLVLLLRASLQRQSGTLSQKWNGNTARVVLLYCLPVFVLQLVVILVGPKLKIKNEENYVRIPHYFTTIAAPSPSDSQQPDVVALCTYPLLSVIVLGLFASLLTVYLLWLGRQMVSSVINKGLRRRVYLLIFSVTCFFPLRVILLGLSVRSQPEQLPFEALVFLAFLVLLYCAGVGICMLVYFPVADSLALRALRDLEDGVRSSDYHNDTTSLIANQSPFEVSSATSLGRNSDASTKRGSISFRTMLKDEASPEVYEELCLLSPATHQLALTPGSPPPGRSMLPLDQVSELFWAAAC